MSMRIVTSLIMRTRSGGKKNADVIKNFEVIFDSLARIHLQDVAGFLGTSLFL